MVQVRFRPPGPVARDFMRSDAFVRAIRGPIGSAKSSSSVMEVFRRICDQKPGPDGLRKSRWAIIRNTYAELRDTTIKTWQDWLPPEHFGEIAMNPPPFRQTMRFNDVEAEILFMALDKPEDVKKLLSLELTGAWINEAREVPKSIVDAATSRLRRYPSMKDGGASWSGLIMDTNSPDDDHWWPVMSGESPIPEGMTAEEALMLVKPTNWEFFTQPQAMLEKRNSEGIVTGYEINPEAENLANLHADYYPQLIQGKTRNWISVYVLNRIGADFDGRKVHPHFSPEVHVSNEQIDVAEGHSVIAGADFGLTPACIFWQFVMGQWRALGEIVLENSDAGDLADAIIHYKARRFPNNKLIGWGDPAGDVRSGTDKRTPFQIMRAKGLDFRPTETNDPEIRRKSMSGPLQRMANGRPGLIISGRDCPVLVKGLSGGWHYRRIHGAGGEKYSTEAEKNKYSHPCEAGEYGLQGGGEGRKALGREPGKGKQANGRVDLNPLDRLNRPRSSRPRLSARFG